MTRLVLPFLILPLSVMLLPAYAEVTSLQTDHSLYSADMEIYFSGTVDSSDTGKLVNLMVFDPSGKLVMMTGGYAESNGTFQIPASTNDPTQFGLKGTYSASAFVNAKSDGKTIEFDFSPDGSPVTHTTQTPAAGLKHSETMDEQMAASDLTNMSRLQAQSPLAGHLAAVGLSDVIYPVMAACGAVIVVFIAYHRKKRAAKPSAPSQEAQVDDSAEPDYAMMILKNRLAKGEISLDEFKTMKDVLSEH